MKLYVSNRVREAGKILEIVAGPDSYLLKLEDGEEVRVSAQFIERHTPQVGGYFVRYPDDGYESYCPAPILESDSYTEVSSSSNGQMTFGGALALLKERLQGRPGRLAPTGQIRVLG